jgi:DNA (cytosine-5)-methyltransferase 1
MEWSPDLERNLAAVHRSGQWKREQRLLKLCHGIRSHGDLAASDVLETAPARPRPEPRPLAMSLLPSDREAAYVALLDGPNDAPHLPDETEWTFVGGKTARYRQIGNAFPPPVAAAVGRSVMTALRHEGAAKDLPELAEPTLHDSVYKILRDEPGLVTPDVILRRSDEALDLVAIERRVAHLSRDFIVEAKATPQGSAYKLGAFKGFVGQDDHERHDYFAKHRSKVS